MKNIRRCDGVAKLNGSIKFLDDYKMEDMLYGYLYYAKFDHGKLKGIKYPSGYDLNEFTIVNAQDIPGKNEVPEPECDQPFMAESEVLHFGQIMLGVAHANKDKLKIFCEAIEVEYEELPAITDIDECLDDENNAFGKVLEIDHRRNIKIESHWIKTHHIYRTPHQEHVYMETQGMLAYFKPESRVMNVIGTLQCPFFVKEAVEAIMGDNISDAIVEASEGIGGGFGGKEDFPNVIAGITALLAYKSGKPVKTVLDRADDILITTKRHPSRIEIVSYTDPDSQKIKSLRIDLRLDAGAYQTLSPVVLSRSVLHASGGYSIEDSYIMGRLFRSNTPPNGAFRGFGAPQAIYAIEAHLDRVAAHLNIDPYRLRQNNVLQIGAELPSSQKIREDHLAACLEKVVEISDYQKKNEEFKLWNKTHTDKRGIGLSLGLHGGGYTGNGENMLDSEVRILITADADIAIYVANTDMGQGAYTTLAQMVSEAIDHPISKTKVINPNTGKTPNSGPTVASRTIYIVGNLLRKLALQIKADLQFSDLSAYVKANADDFPLEFRTRFLPDPDIYFDDDTYQGVGYKDFSWAACVVEIYFHADTYEVEIKKCWNVMDVGQTVNPSIAMGQAHGGIIQGLAFGLSEFFYKKGFGRKQGLTDYTMMTSSDMPEIEVEFLYKDSLLPKGLGELPMDFPAPALRNAFYHATGIFIDELPLTPERIFQAMKDRG
jgi:CO/xanthine dehydrogenase Mo-binding subunit